MTSYLKILCCLFILAGCGATVPQQTETKVNRPDSVFPTRPEPADVAVLPFKNQTGDPELDFLGARQSVLPWPSDLLSRKPGRPPAVL